MPDSRGRSARPGARWTAEDADLDGVTIDDAVRSALVVNLLPADNLAHYSIVIERLFGRDGVWIEWVRRWTATDAAPSADQRTR